MMTIKNALDKLDTGAKEKITDKYGAVIKTYVHSALAGFCKQDESFAQAVIDGGTFAECVKHCTEGISGNTGISDIDIYRRAVQFYFPGAQVDFHISIITEGAETRIHEEPERKETKRTKSITEQPEPITEELEPITEQQNPITEERKVETKPKKQPKKIEKPKNSNVIQLDLFA